METNIQRFQKAKREQEANYSNTNYVFTESRRYIEASMGIELTLVELVRLKELARESIDRNSQVKGHWSRANPINDATEIFLHDYYGVPLAIESSTGNSNDWLCGRHEFKEKSGYDGYREFWKRRQEDAHLP